MANTLQIRRSSVSLNVPTTAQLALGELAINTNDGKLFFKRDNGVQSIIEVSVVGHTHAGVYEPANANIQSHISNASNPHGVTAAQSGAEPTLGFTPVNKAGDAIQFLNISGGLGGLIDTSSKTNSYITPYSTLFAASPMAMAWHDVIAFNKTATPTFETYNGAWNSAALNSRHFAQQESFAIIVCDGVTNTAARWTWNSGAFNFCLAEWLVIGFNYTNPVNERTVLWETSVDGFTWTTKHTSTHAVNNAPVWHYMPPLALGQYLRLTLTSTNATPVKINAIRLLTKRWGDEGKGSELGYPYTWDKNQNIIPGGTVDGRDIATDGTNQDNHIADVTNPHAVTAAQIGVEAGATADQTAAEILAALITVDGSGSGLDADLLDGQNLSSAAGNNTVVQRNASGHIYSNHHNLSRAASNAIATHYMYEQGSDGFILKKTLANVKAEIVTGAAVNTALGYTPEIGLGNPTTNGYVLSSTIAGVRSWVAQSGGGGGAQIESAAFTASSSLNGTTGSVTFPTAFASAPASVVISGNATTNSIICVPNTITVTGFSYTIYNNGNAGSGVNWSYIAR